MAAIGGPAGGPAGRAGARARQTGRGEMGNICNTQANIIQLPGRRTQAAPIDLWAGQF